MQIETFIGRVSVKHESLLEKINKLAALTFYNNITYYTSQIFCLLL